MNDPETRATGHSDKIEQAGDQGPGGSSLGGFMGTTPHPPAPLATGQRLNDGLVGPFIYSPLDLLQSLVDDSECRFDHHGGCQEHGYLSLQPGEKCPQAELKELIAPHLPTEEAEVE